MGEFGGYSPADINSRTLWTQHVARSAEARNISWAYWEFNIGFGVHDSKKTSGMKTWFSLCWKKNEDN